ncbi:hypothetical protein LCGC14_2952820 [marine sediment metagenome]|uniref:Uncharacterized protein n=1 Tax=marine sediment metagenome TaxID=412755 RepID=A0A0F8ZMD4_9ZZZZ
MTNLLKRVEKVLDDFNGEHGNVDNSSLCQWCSAGTIFDGYGPEKGIAHRPDCIILELREAIANLPEENL